MEESEILTIKQRSVKGVLALTSRSFIVQVISFAANLILTILLTPSVFGTYFIVTAMTRFFGYFSDVGLAGALIQKKEELTEEDLRTTFTIQQILVVTVVVTALLLSAPIARATKLGSDGLMLFQALSFSLLLSSLKTIPSVLLERKLQFSRLIIPQIIETLTFNIVVVSLAYKGYGINSFTVSILLSGIVGLVSMFIVSPWKVCFGINRKNASGLFKFGLPFQANSILALIKDDLFTIYLAVILPAAQIGFIGWAQKWALYPLRFIMDNVIKITFPAYSRLQDNPDALKSAIEKSIFFVTLAVFPILMGMAICAPIFIEIIPKYGKWQPALFLLYLFCINAAWGAVSTPLTNALNAIGKIKITLYLMVMWTVLTWVLTPIMVYIYGYNGVGLSMAIIPFTSVLTIYALRKFVPINIFDSVKVPFLATILMGIVLIYTKNALSVSPASLLILIFMGALTYSLSLVLLGKDKLRLEIRSITKLHK